MNIQSVKLFEKFLSSKCTEEELRAVKRLLDTDEGKKLLADIMAERDAESDRYFSEETNKASKDKMQEWKTKIDQQIEYEDSIRLVEKRIYSWTSLAKVAVCIGLLLTISVLAVRYLQVGLPEGAPTSYVRKTNNGSVPALFFLPDSSQIYLAAQSYVEYPDHFMDAKRQIKLVGEAFFDVKRDEKRPFIIVSNGIRTTVLGTSFRIKAYEHEDIEVAVVTGRVLVSDLSNQKLSELTPGHSLVYEPDSKKSKHGSVSVDDIINWKTGELYFNDEPIKTIARQLETRYQVHIAILDDQTANYRVSGTFEPGENLDRILRLLGTMGNFRHRKRDQTTYELYKNN